MFCTKSFKRCYFSILVGEIIDYKEQVFITKIKTNVQYFVCHIYLKKQKNLIKL